MGEPAEAGDQEVEGFEAPEPPERRPFSQWLLEQRGGVAHAETSDALQAVVSGVVEHEKVGELNLKIKVKPSGDGRSVLITDELKTKVPEADKPATFFFTDDNGNVSRRDPNQPELPLRSVDKKTGELRSAKRGS